MTVEQLLQHVNQSCEDGASILRNKWIPSCVKIISDNRDDVEVVMPEGEVRVVMDVYKMTLVNIFANRKSLFVCGLLESARSVTQRSFHLLYGERDLRSEVKYPAVPWAL